MAISPEEFRLFRDYIERECGIRVGDAKEYLVESRLSSLMTQNGCATFGDFYALASGNRAPGLRDRIVDAMTTNETLWFRDNHPFSMLSEVFLRQMADEIIAGKRTRIRIWSAACSTGQEPYSIAMTIEEFARKRSVLPLEYVDIVATDISPSVLFSAMAGRYTGAVMTRGMPDDFRARYFDKAGEVWAIKERIRKMVRFKKFNLQEDFGPLGRFDAIFCRNVAIYFSDEFKRALFKRFAALLRPAGYLVLGASESISGYAPNDFRMHTHEKGIYYRVH
ncbi:MAG: hypothetical protein A2268_08410 [Candidatus Raymondbacteria bacterium RifOxyA12_full_50_37]|uniref:protein-glutamate O-methyltransferase n=1 Tax=Candidatus Raymondbacteria bacterium RIFOXYD12_FULL_49_13 TaxID=1817890 RepID=A0A1F7F3R1_UNCRA|nr:MAG: hypothetical protein A2268_08410 [Candidatus Raymondbacteria bacterium RifOxyA12_full_50_37]OGJ90355.1 MAG: hypothetical protein A2248_17345 [Candidatus Raymondbacteria bacterium RIFOXYA2_FULL_49_16]OGK01310.1 MAG: hypothetical protein A2519_12970 [Candidatus Raymondbacteria bacterium RIFOXYD12_FULL_49_13]OGP43254.1 MAG: hypothetical protein A2324_08175 [Candidatus Raymondbacteria bacterium RIFOXYB2_FULL_49_35]